LSEHYAQASARGEITVLMGPAQAAETGADDLDRQLHQALLTHSVKDAAALVAGAANLPKRTVYARALELAQQNREGGGLPARRPSPDDQ
jgi:16S rRNA (cytidine1402-2'-O)-methyltransferase